ncbi:MAG: hypothetical protein N4A49_08215 [Marinifilaceae bacterium]|nr:hypothetical protein [Marinifilaceae bacterium]
MNLSPIINWSYKLLSAFHKLSNEEQDRRFKYQLQQLNSKMHKKLQKAF